MIYGSVCSGIEAATVAWHPLGWKAAFYAEIEKFPSAVLAHHYPTVPNFGDFTLIQPEQHDAIDLLVGGTPCQSFSIAGLRGGLADDRGNLALEFLRLAQRARPRWLVWENVPGVLSSGGGRDFGAILGGMVELGYGIAYRVLDAQYVRVDGFWRAVPQRRRRVFVVGYLGDWRRAAAVLFERASLLGDNAPRRDAGERIAPTISARPSGGGGLGTDFDCDGGLVASTLDASYGRLQGCSGQDANHGHSHLVAQPFNITPSNSNKDYNARATQHAQALTAGGNAPSARGGDVIAIQERAVSENAENGPQGSGIRDDGASYTLEARHHVQAVAYGLSTQQEPKYGVDVSPTLTVPSKTGGGQPTAVVKGWAVRRLMPVECERLQAFPDNYTLIPWRKGEAPDGPRYKALGNSMAVNVMRWIGRRIEMVEAMASIQQAAE